MAKQLDRALAAEFEDRIRRLAADTPRRWGTLDARSMLAHLTRSFEISLSEVQAPDQSIPVLRHLIAFLAFRLLPIPRGRIKVPEIFTPQPEQDFEAERRRCLDGLARFMEAVEREPGRKTVNSLTGPTTLSYWRRIHGKHMEHHLRQFGV